MFKRFFYKFSMQQGPLGPCCNRKFIKKSLCWRNYIVFAIFSIIFDAARAFRPLQQSKIIEKIAPQSSFNEIIEINYISWNDSFCPNINFLPKHLFFCPNIYFAQTPILPKQIFNQICCKIVWTIKIWNNDWRQLLK